MCHLIFLSLFFAAVDNKTFNTCPLCRVPYIALHLWQAWAVYLAGHLSHIARRLLPTRTFLPNETLSYGSHHKLQGRDAVTSSCSWCKARNCSTGCGTGMACVNQSLEDTSMLSTQKGLIFWWTIRVKFNYGLLFLCVFGQLHLGLSFTC